MTASKNPFQRIWLFLRRFEARVLAGMALAAGALWAFLTLGGEMLEGETGDVDRRLILMFRTPGHPDDPIGSRGIEEAVRDVTALGGTTLVTVVTVVAVLAFAFHRRWRHAAVMAGAVLAAWASSNFTKAFYHRPRPDLVPHEVYVYSGSFPSGHSTLSAATWLTLAMLIASLETRRRTKALVYVVAGVILAGVGVSRVYLGVHWPSDVLAGWCLGSMWALAGWLALRAAGGKVRG
ncbi:MAG: phosphatase PAP2 family protein [Phenylobacterium sp.]|uniref:phosphatase PAP2 family protein n=1 Tax=Phenylobacterium sp. TaxID=1871053 RepID=UPI0025D39019|nr:phosphatase PAP2 family protein [Phenylobacterium sp.]MBI1196342.1 phosphatase PAP2 family protein [Phenylobacterium sp.]